MAEEGIDKAGLKQALKLGTIHEFERADTPFIDTFNRIDQTLFTGSEGTRYSHGYRTQPVRLMDHLAAPLPANVPELMTKLCNKVTEVRLDPRIIGNSRERLALSAWVMGMSLAVHPKLDGNGRLTKGVGEFLNPSKALLDYSSPLWEQALIQTESDIVNEISRTYQTPIPDIFNHPERTSPDDIQKLDQAIWEFYFPGDQDRVTKLLGKAIDETGFDQDGHFAPKGLSPEVLQLWKQFIEQAPGKSDQANFKDKRPGRFMGFFRRRIA